MNREESIRETLEQFLGRSLYRVQLEPVEGGCINHAARINADGSYFFVKWNDHPLPNQFTAEAAGLRALAGAGSGLVIPDVVAAHDDPGNSYLILEYIQPARRREDFAETLGRGLARLHQVTTDRGFGFDLDGYCGATPQPNGWAESWLEFFRERRLRFQISLAERRGLTIEAAAELNELADRLEEWLDPSEPPALIHGDLWSGNVHVDPDGRPGLVDPAVYYAHREAELGMMQLFGGFPPGVWSAYEEAYPLNPGWRERANLYGLYHVLNHYNLFGGVYANQALSVARAFLG